MVSLVAGIVIGFFCSLKDNWLKMVQWLTMAGLFILLAAMGAQLGSNEKVLANLERIGLQALLLASLAVLGSIIAVYIVFRWLESGKPGSLKEDEKQ